MSPSQTAKKENQVLTVRLEGKNKDMFFDLKEEWNLKYNIEVFHQLLKKIHDLEFGSKE